MIQDNKAYCIGGPAHGAHVSSKNRYFNVEFAGTAETYQWFQGPGVPPVWLFGPIHRKIKPELNPKKAVKELFSLQLEISYQIRKLLNEEQEGQKDKADGEESQETLQPAEGTEERPTVEEESEAQGVEENL